VTLLIHQKTFESRVSGCTETAALRAAMYVVDCRLVAAGRQPHPLLKPQRSSPGLVTLTPA
jgi:hypothetical protein